MMKFRNLIVHSLAMGVVLVLGAAASLAQDYPARPITLVVPYPAGGGNDVLGRLVAERMAKALKGAIVVENRGGAGGTIGTRQVAKAAPDGYTMLIATSSLAINPSLYPNVGYDPGKDFAPIGLLASGANVVLVHPSVPAKSIAELIALAKKEPGKLNFASTGSGSSVHLAAELFAAMAGIRINHVPYRGSGPALNDLLGGHVTMMFATLPSAIGIVKGGKVRALAVTGAKRSAVFPELPTIAEAGLAGYQAELHYGLVAPAGTPRPIIDRLNVALRTVLEDVALRERLAREGAVPMPSTPEEYAADIEAEEKKWGKIVRDAGVKGE
jgi:tripartite-type tricarboxylate transporter receptor subunit TctC